MSESDRAELAKLRSEMELSSLGDKPYSISADKLRRLIELESQAAVSPTTLPACPFCNSTNLEINGRAKRHLGEVVARKVNCLDCEASAWLHDWTTRVTSVGADAAARNRIRRLIAEDDPANYSVELSNEDVDHLADITTAVFDVDMVRLRLAEYAAEAASAFCDELQEDADAVPQAELEDLHASLDEWQAVPRTRRMYDDTDLVMAALAGIVSDGYATDNQRRAAALGLKEIERLRSPSASPSDAAEITESEAFLVDRIAVDYGFALKPRTVKGVLGQGQRLWVKRLLPRRLVRCRVRTWTE